MSDDRVLPIARTPAAKCIPAEQLGHLNAAFYRTQLRQSEARKLEMRLRLAVIEAEKAARGFVAIRDAVADGLGLHAQTLRWDMETGEALPEVQHG